MTEIINRQKDMECVGAANDPLVAREMIRELNPDVITLDIEMPKMDGIDFLARLMRLRPMPVVMISTLTERGAEVTMRALELGAVDFVGKAQNWPWRMASTILRRKLLRRFGLPLLRRFGVYPQQARHPMATSLVWRRDQNPYPSRGCQRKNSFVSGLQRAGQRPLRKYWYGCPPTPRVSLLRSICHRGLRRVLQPDSIRYARYRCRRP